MATRIEGLDVHVLDESAAAPDRFLLWHHGSPQTGAILAPVAAAARRHGFGVVSIARPGYAGSARRPGRTCADVAGGVGAVLDALGIRSVVAVGASGGGPHALACAAVLPDRVEVVLTYASPAPYRDEESWFTGMRDAGGLRAAVAGERDRVAYAQADEFDPESFNDADRALLAGAWRSLGEDAGRAQESGPWGLIDDDLAFTRGWGFGLEDVRAPVVVHQGDDDRVIPAHHGRFLAEALPDARLRERAGAGHISILRGLDRGVAEAVTLRQSRA